MPPSDMHSFVCDGVRTHSTRLAHHWPKRPRPAQSGPSAPARLERPGPVRQGAAKIASLIRAAAPTTPASSPISLSTTGRLPVASGRERR